LRNSSFEEKIKQLLFEISQEYLNEILAYKNDHLLVDQHFFQSVSRIRLLEDIISTIQPKKVFLTKITFEGVRDSVEKESTKAEERFFSLITRYKPTYLRERIRDEMRSNEYLYVLRSFLSDFRPLSLATSEIIREFRRFDIRFEENRKFTPDLLKTLNLEWPKFYPSWLIEDNLQLVLGSCVFSPIVSIKERIAKFARRIDAIVVDIYDRTLGPLSEWKERRKATAEKELKDISPLCLISFRVIKERALDISKASLATLISLFFPQFAPIILTLGAGAKVIGAVIDP
jgi:hypothetical protein